LNRFQNTLQDHKNKFLPYSKQCCWGISQMFCVYVHVMSVFSIFIFFSQVDFLIIRCLADVIVSGYSTYMFIKGKVYDRDKYFNSDQNSVDLCPLCEIDENNKQAAGPSE
jgi:hypothetical protein